MELVRYLREVIAKRGLSLGEIAERMQAPDGKEGLDRALVSQWLSERIPRSIPAARLAEFASILGLPLSELVCRLPPAEAVRKGMELLKDDTEILRAILRRLDDRGGS